MVAESTEIFVFGKKRVALRTCGDGLDRTSMHAIALVGMHVGLLATDGIGDFDPGFDNPLAR